MNRRTLNAALAASVASAFVLAALPASAQQAEREKCFGVALAGKNDCAAGAGTTCAGTAKRDYQGNAWSYTAKGSCTTMNSPSSPSGKGQLAAFTEKRG